MVSSAVSESEQVCCCPNCTVTGVFRGDVPALKPYTLDASNSFGTNHSESNRHLDDASNLSTFVVITCLDLIVGLARRFLAPLSRK